jgi:hypothetical protein
MVSPSQLGSPGVPSSVWFSEAAIAALGPRAAASMVPVMAIPTNLFLKFIVYLNSLVSLWLAVVLMHRSP